NDRLQPAGQVLKWLRNAEIDPAYRKDEYEPDAPEAKHAVQLPDQTLPTQAAMHSQTPAPCLDARPPDHQTGGRQRQHHDCAETVHPAANWSSEQIVVQIEQLRHEPDAERDGLAEIAARPRIEEPVFDLIAAPQLNAHGFIQIPRPD